MNRRNKSTYSVDGFERRNRSNDVIVISDDEDEPSPTQPNVNQASPNPYLQFEENALVIKREKLLEALQEEENAELAGFVQQNPEIEPNIASDEMQSSNINQISPPRPREYTLSPTSDSGINEIDSDYSLDLALPAYNRQNVIRAENGNVKRTFEGVLARNETKRFAQNNSTINNYKQPESKTETDNKTTSEQLSTNVAHSKPSVPINRKQINDKPKNERSKNNSTSKKRRGSSQSVDSNIENSIKRNKPNKSSESMNIPMKKEHKTNEASTSTAPNLLVNNKDDNLIDISDCESISSTETVAIQDYFDHPRIPGCELISSSEGPDNFELSLISECEPLSSGEADTDQEQSKQSRILDNQSIRSTEFSRPQIQQPGNKINNSIVVTVRKIGT